jgi:hypothetical protein
MPDLTTKEGVVALMESSRTPDEWNQNCDTVKSANGGDYPLFWWKAIVKSGLADCVLRDCGSDAEIRFKVFSHPKGA